MPFLLLCLLAPPSGLTRPLPLLSLTSSSPTSMLEWRWLWYRLRGRRFFWIEAATDRCAEMKGHHLPFMWEEEGPRKLMKVNVEAESHSAQRCMLPV